MGLRSRFLNALRRLVGFWYERTGPVRVLFLVRNKIGFSCLRPLLLELERRGTFRIGLTLEFDGCMAPPEAPGDRALFDRYFIPNRLAVWRKWHYVVASDMAMTYFKWGQVVVQMPHGSAFGNLDATVSGEDHWLKTVRETRRGMIFLNSVSSYQTLLAAEPTLKTPGRAFFVCGSPKLDSLVTEGPEAGKRFLEELGLSPDRKTVVLTSHWTEKSVLRSLGKNILDQLASLQDDFNVIITGHEKLWFDPARGGPAAPSELADHAARLAELHENIRFVTLLDEMTALLKAGDVFICDNSSILVDVCLAGRPLVFFDHPDFEFGDPTVGALYRACGANFQQAENVPALVKRALSAPQEKAEARAAVADYFLARRGGAASYMADIFAEAGRVSGPWSPRWARIQAIAQREMAQLSAENFPPSLQNSAMLSHTKAEV